MGSRFFVLDGLNLNLAFPNFALKLNEIFTNQYFTICYSHGSCPSPSWTQQRCTPCRPWCAQWPDGYMLTLQIIYSALVNNQIIFNSCLWRKNIFWVNIHSMICRKEYVPSWGNHGVINPRTNINNWWPGNWWPGTELILYKSKTWGAFAKWIMCSYVICQICVHM